MQICNHPKINLVQSIGSFCEADSPPFMDVSCSNTGIMSWNRIISHALRRCAVYLWPKSKTDKVEIKGGEILYSGPKLCGSVYCLDYKSLLLVL